MSNVPFVAVYNVFIQENEITENDVSQWFVLASSSTIAGNLIIFGTASNIIVTESAESRKIKCFTFTEY